MPVDTYEGKPCPKGHVTRYVSSGRCVECKQKYHRKWRRDNPDYHRKWRDAHPDYGREWREANPEKTQKYQREWQEANSEKLHEYHREWRKANPEYYRNLYARDPEKYKARVRKRRKDNPEHVIEYNRKRYARDPERFNAMARKWERENPEKRKAAKSKRRTLKTNAGGSFTGIEFIQLCEAYKNECLACGKKKKLTADHIIPVSKGGNSFISNIQPLCKSCNSTKGTKTIDYRPFIPDWIMQVSQGGRS